MTPDHIAIIERQARSNYTYLLDPVDNWRVHTGSILLGSGWVGDCDDMSSTMIDMLARAGQPLSKLWFVIVNTRGEEGLNHLIAVVEDNNGAWWVTGDTATNLAKPYPVSDLKYRVLAWASATAPLIWNKTPFTETATPAT